MSPDPEDLARLLQRVLAPTPAGRDELREPRLGLSLPQRWLLGQFDGQTELATLSLRPGSPSQERFPRDAARLLQLGLVEDGGAADRGVGNLGIAASPDDPSLDRSADGAPGVAPAAQDTGMRMPPAAVALPARAMTPRVVTGVALLALGGVAVYLVAGGNPASTGPVAAGPAPGIARTTAAPGASTSAASPAPALAGAEPSAAQTPEPSDAARAGVLAVTAARPPSPPGPTPAPSPARGAGIADARPAATGQARAAAAPPSATLATVDPTPRPAPAPTPATTVAEAAAAPAAEPASAPVPVPGTPVAGAQVSGTPAAAAAVALRPLRIVEPAFPREGAGQGGRPVNLQARLTVDASGAVTAVAFVPSSPATRIFEREAREALLQWRFPPGPGERQYTQRLRFSEE